MRHKKIRKTAEFIEEFIKMYRKARHRKKTLPRRVVRELIRMLFPISKPLGKGFYKDVYWVRSAERQLVLKFGREKAIKNDIRVYKSVPKSIQNRFFAKIYWGTPHFLLQKYGKKVKVSDKVLKQLKREGKKYCLTDIRRDNIRKVDGHFKVVDANPKRR